MKLFPAIYPGARLFARAVAAFFLAGASILATAPVAHADAGQCATATAWSELEFGAARDEARMLLAQATELSITPRKAVATPQARPAQMQQLSNPAKAEIDAVRRQASSMLASSSSLEAAMRDARVALQNVASYAGSDGEEMNRLLAEVDAAGEALFKSMQVAGNPGEVQSTEAFECNKDRRQCKADCEAEKGKKCCCGCGMTYIACVLL
ncbi:hypothetical protein [Pseudohaliea sp.]|uniref:hypothetical protein n=1 Tax=Pseudohaliea sp. TaxID=2740289 RepID=UPI0032EB7F41